jgi:hypothetical protein
MTTKNDTIRINRELLARDAAELYRTLIEYQNRSEPGHELAELHPPSDETPWVDGFQFARLSMKVEAARMALQALVFELSADAARLLHIPTMDNPALVVEESEE